VRFLMIADKYWPHLSMARLRLTLSLTCAVFLLALMPFSHAADGVFPAVDRVIAVGDIHGDFDNFRKVLQDAEIIDRRGNWIGNDTHLVQLGDLPDRGPDTDKIIELMRELQDQAAQAGGMVHPLIGNHEAMNIYGDLRYVHPDEFAAFRTSRSRDYRLSYYESEVARLTALDPEFTADKLFRDQWMEQHPLGYVEHRIAWSPSGEIGSWVSQNNAVLKIGRTLFLHGGISEKLLPLSIDDINNQVRSELQGNLPEEPGLSEADDGPLWYRGLASNAEEIEAAHVDAVLAAYNVDRIVIAHTPGMGTIVPRFGGKVLIIDTGISAYYGSHLASLLIESDNYYTLQNSEKIPLPSTQAQTLEYFEAISSITEATPLFQQRLQNLQESAIKP
jgi:hypothetical protein